jgi:hypothetical protein
MQNVGCNCKFEFVTQKKIDRLKKKISDIKRTLAAEKRKFGGYDDSRGLRYAPTKYYIQLADYAGGLTYTKWFDKNFPDDAGFPSFLFEWTIILFKTGLTKEAEKKALQTFMSNTYLFDKFLEKDFLHFDKYEGSNWEKESLTKNFEYSKSDAELNDFTDWLELFVTSKKFNEIANEFISIEQRLETEPVGRSRTALVNKLYSLLDKYV